MAVRIRLQRCGKPKKPFYRIVVIDSRRQRDSQPIEYIGHYNPLIEEGNIGTVNNQRLTYWLKCGAKLSERVNSILKKFKEYQVKQEGEL